MKDQVAVVGVGCTKFGDMFEHGYEDLICEAAFAAYADAKIDPREIQAAYLGTYLPGPGGGKSAVSLADALRLYERPITRVENYCATGTDAFRNGCLAVAAGVYDVVHAGRDGEAAVPERVGAGRAVVLDPGDRPVVEPERIGERDGSLAAAGAGEVRAEVRGLDLPRIDAGVLAGRERGIADELLEAPLEAVAELRAADADDRDLVLHHASAGRAFQK